MELYLVRHGETDWNRERRIQGSTDIALNGTGRAQAADTGRLLSRRHWHAVYSSPLSRAMETAEIIAARLGIAAPSGIGELAERAYGAAEGLTTTDMDRLFPGDAEVPGRETRVEVVIRVMPALLAIARSHPGEAVIAVTHGGVIRSILGAIDPGGHHPLITNGSVHSFRYEDDALALVAFDDPIETESAHGSDVVVQNAVERRDAPQL